MYVSVYYSSCDSITVEVSMSLVSYGEGHNL